MDLIDLDNFLKNKYPGKSITYLFPPETHRSYEIVMDKGIPNTNHHVECRRVLVEVEGIDPEYWDIQPHRLTVTHEHMEILINDMLKRKS